MSLLGRQRHLPSRYLDIRAPLVAYPKSAASNYSSPSNWVSVKIYPCWSEPLDLAYELNGFETWGKKPLSILIPLFFEVSWLRWTWGSSKSQHTIPNSFLFVFYLHQNTYHRYFHGSIRHVLRLPISMNLLIVIDFLNFVSDIHSNFCHRLRNFQVRF